MILLGSSHRRLRLLSTILTGPEIPRHVPHLTGSTGEKPNLIMDPGGHRRMLGKYAAWTISLGTGVGTCVI